MLPHALYLASIALARTCLAMHLCGSAFSDIATALANEGELLQPPSSSHLEPRILKVHTCFESCKRAGDCPHGFAPKVPARPAEWQNAGSVAADNCFAEL